MVEDMQPFTVSTSSITPTDDTGLAVGTGAGIVMAVAASLIGIVTLLVSTYASPAHAAALGAQIESEASTGTASIALAVVAIAWIVVTADLWRALINRVKTRSFLRS